MAKNKKKTKKEIAKAKISNFNREFRKVLVTAIVSAFGLLVALVWKDVITEWVDKISQSSPIQGKLISALIVTIIAVIGILVVTRFLSVKEDKK